MTFGKMMTFLAVDVVVPCRITMKSNIMEMFADLKLKIQCVLNRPDRRISLTSGIWSTSKY